MSEIEGERENTWYRKLIDIDPALDGKDVPNGGVIENENRNARERGKVGWEICIIINNVVVRLWETN